jgi:hypothetical protein
LTKWFPIERLQTPKTAFSPTLDEEEVSLPSHLSGCPVGNVFVSKQQNQRKHRYHIQSRNKGRKENEQSQQD